MPFPLNRAKVTPAMHRRSSATPARRRLSPSSGGGAASAADQLHAERVAWGRLWGARIAKATREWKELR